MDLPLADGLEEKRGSVNRARRLVGEGRPLDETTRSQMETLLGRDLKDVRVHDSRQAGELAGRLGGEAFTSGNHIFAPSGKLAPGSREGAGLLAHELTHVVQQARPRELPGERPLASPPAPGQPQRGEKELQTQGTEQAVVRESVQRAEAGSAPAGRRGRQPDAEEIADIVYHMMLRDLVLERERRCRP